ncbi:MAG: DUF6404 family protein, partial [Cardiobacterium sp.]
WCTISKRNTGTKARKTIKPSALTTVFLKEFMMSYPPSVEKALVYLKAADIPKFLKNEKWWFVHRFFWRHGIALPPAILANFAFNFVYFGINGILIFLSIPLIFIYIQHWHNGLTALQWVVYGIIYFITYGAMMAYSTQRQRQKLNLLTWQEVKNLPDTPSDNHA